MSCLIIHSFTHSEILVECHHVLGTVLDTGFHDMQLACMNMVPIPGGFLQTVSISNTCPTLSLRCQTSCSEFGFRMYGCAIFGLRAHGGSFSPRLHLDPEGKDVIQVAAGRGPRSCCGGSCGHEASIAPSGSKGEQHPPQGNSHVPVLSPWPTLLMLAQALCLSNLPSYSKPETGPLHP